jgi:endonuclease-3
MSKVHSKFFIQDIKRNIQMKENLANKVFESLSQINQNPKTELQYTNNFTLAIAVILSAQATDISVNKATQYIFPKYDSPVKILTLGENKFKEYIKTIGLYNSKAKNIIALCQILIDKYNSEIPSDFDELIKLPGIGRKTANVILNCAFDKGVVAVDTHVYRVSHRLGLSSKKLVEQVEKDLNDVIPIKWLAHAHNWLVLHGRYICKARKPLCGECSLRNYCQYYNYTEKK